MDMFFCLCICVLFKMTACSLACCCVEVDSGEPPDVSRWPKSVLVNAEVEGLQKILVTELDVLAANVSSPVEVRFPLRRHIWL